jgi:hypothetical protein
LPRPCHALLDDAAAQIRIDQAARRASHSLARTRIRDPLAPRKLGAVDYLGTRGFVDRDRIGAIGICGSGSFVVSAPPRSIRA